MSSLEATGPLIQEAEAGGTTLVHACNGYNDLVLMVMLWMVQYRWPSGSRFMFNFYKHWTQLILRRPGSPPVTLLRQEGVTQGDPHSVVLHRITLVPLEEDLRAADPGLLDPLYADVVSFKGLARWSAQLLKLILWQGSDQGKFHNMEKSLFIENFPGKDAAVR